MYDNPNTWRIYDLDIQSHVAVLNDIGTMPEWLTGRPATCTQSTHIEAVLYERVSSKKSENLTGVGNFLEKWKALRDRQ